jgi:hypothetical protein
VAGALRELTVVTGKALIFSVYIWLIFHRLHPPW